MKALLNYIIITLLLLFIGTGAIYGGLSFILHPDGSGLNMDMHWLNRTPFSSYLIPGLLLLIFNGITSMLILLAIIFGSKVGYSMAAYQGIVLILWILIQMLLIRTVNFLHVTLAVMGLILIIVSKNQNKLITTTD